jgi:hypothetical protein
MRGKAHIFLGVLQLAVALGAIPAGYSMIVHPDGSGLKMTVEILAGSPFKDFFIPGLFLFVINGLFNLASSVLCFYEFRYTSLIGIMLGAALIIWVIVQVYSVGLSHILQPVYFVIGILEIVLSLLIKTDGQNMKNPVRGLI